MINPTQAAEQFFCRVLCGDLLSWTELSPEVGVDDFLQLSQHHGIQALLFHAMHTQQPWQSWPLEVRQRLESASKAGVARDMLRTHHLNKLLEELRIRNVRSVLTKGEALSQTHYVQPGSRSRSDTDLFVSIADIELVKEAIKCAGFEIRTSVYKGRQFVARRPEDPDGAVSLDVHWRILNAPRYAQVISFDDAYAESEVLVGHGGARTLGTLHSLLLACMHRYGSSTHDRNRLVWLYDIHLLVSSMTDEQLQFFAEKAVRSGVQTECLDGLLLTQARFQTKLPEDVLDLLRSPTPGNSFSSRFRNSQLGLFLDDWKQLPNNRSRRDLLGELFFPSADNLLFKYHKHNRFWLPVLYLRRVFEGFGSRLMLR